VRLVFSIGRWLNPALIRRVRFLEPRPDAKRVYTDANQVCWNKAKLRRAKPDQADDQTVDNRYQKSRPRFPSDEDGRQYSEKAREIV